MASNVEHTSYDFGIIFFLTKHLFSTSSCHSSPGPYPLDQRQFTWFSLKAQWLLWAEGHGYLPGSRFCQSQDNQDSVTSFGNLKIFLALAINQK